MRRATTPGPTRRWRASRARSSCSTTAGSSRRNGPARAQASRGIENFRADLGLARHRTDVRPTRAACCSTATFAGGEKHRITGLVENQREQFSFDSIFLFGPDLDAARNGYTRTTNSVGGEYVLDLLRTGTTISVAQRAGLQRALRGRVHLALFDLAEVRHDRRAAAFERRARRHQPELHRAVRLHHQHIQPNPNLVPESSIGWDAGWEQRFWNGRVARRRDLFQFAAGARDRPEVAAKLQNDGREPRLAPRRGKASKSPASSGRSTG